MCFSVTVRTNKFALKQNEKYSPEQEKIFKKIKSLHQSGLGYRKIANKLNAENITTYMGKKWGFNNVYSVLKRHKEREDRLEFINKEYEPVWGKMEVKLLMK
ncbi:MAG: recombinase family protein [Paracoccaceae bacterium]